MKDQTCNQTCNQFATEYITKQAALDAISCDITITGRRNAELVAETIATFADRIKALPSAQPKMGMWVSKPYKRARICSCCGHDEPYKFADDDATIFNFCPNCGADMRGEQNEQMPLPDTCGAPAAEPSVGKWIEKEAGTEDKEEGWETVIVCSRCDFTATTFYSKDGEERTQIRTRFCPNCGAKMERGTVAIVGRGSGKSAAQLEAIKKKVGFEE